MIRILTAAAVAALVAAPAYAQSVHISTAGKTPEQLRTEIVRAANRLCTVETQGASFPIQANEACIKHTVATTLAQSKNPALLLAQR